MNVVIWARVSSREQREGYSIDAQLRVTRDKAERESWHIVREFVVAESAKRGSERYAFNEMYDWIRKNARRQRIDAILSHKLDRVCRNMRDAVRLQELEDLCGVKLAFVDNQFGPGAAGALSFNVMAAVAQYYSDNLRSEVLKGMDEKVKQGWLPGWAPYGYRNVPDRKEPIQPDPEQSAAVIRIFELYSKGDHTFTTLAEQLWREGHVYRPSAPQFGRTALSYILNNRFYVGEINWRGKTVLGQHRPLIPHHLFQLCQELLGLKNRRHKTMSHPLGAGLMRCAHCGHAITGELIRRKRADGSVREHMYYRCANNRPGPDHPKVRWKQADLEAAYHKELMAMKLDEETAAWLREALVAAFAGGIDVQRRKRRELLGRQEALAQMEDRLLTAFLAGSIDETMFQNKSTDIKTQLREVARGLEAAGDNVTSRGDKAVELFEYSQKAADLWQGSNLLERRTILTEFSLNRTLSDVTLCVQKRKPFDLLAERPSVIDGRGDRI